MTANYVLVIFNGESLIRKMRCLDCLRPFERGDRVLFVETIEGDEHIGVAYHEPCAPERVVAGLYNGGYHA